MKRTAVILICVFMILFAAVPNVSAGWYVDVNGTLQYRDDPETGGGGMGGTGAGGSEPASSQYYQYQYKGYRANVSVSGWWQPNSVYRKTLGRANQFVNWVNGQAWPTGASPNIVQEGSGYRIYYNEWISTR